LTQVGIKVGNSGALGKALMVSGAEVVNHLNDQRQDIFFPDENATALDRLGACTEIGGGSVVFAAAVTEVFAGTLTTAAVTGGTAATAGTIATAACADGDCANELQATERILKTGWTVIGKYPAYLEKARELGAKALDIPQAEWNSLGSRAAQWARNVKFLDEAIARGDSFRLATSFAQGWAEQGTFYKDELVYLLQKGYELVTDLNGFEWLVKMEQ
jgi:hypothetical protein